MNLQRKPTDLGQLIQATVDRLTFQAEAQGVALQVEASPNCPSVAVEADRLEQVLVIAPSTVLHCNSQSLRDR